MSVRLLCCSGSLEGGGSERQLWQLATHISRSQFVPAVYLLNRQGVYLDRLPSDVSVWDFWSENSSIPRDGTLLPGGIHRAQVNHLAALIRQQRIDVVYDRTFHMTLITAPACRKAKVPRVSTIVSPPSRDVPHSRERFSFIKKWLLSRAYGDPDCQVVAVSEDVANDAASYYRLPLERILILPSPVDMRGIGRASEETPPWSQEDCRHVVVVGRLSSEKGQVTALDAVYKVIREQNVGTNVKLHLIGDGPDRQQLMQHAADLQIREHVHFHGFLSNPYPAIRAADLLVVPSRYEGLPNVVLEAMALSTPVLATRCSRTLDALLSGEQSNSIHDANKTIADEASADEASADEASADEASANEIGGGRAVSSQPTMSLGHLVPVADAGAMAKAIAGILNSVHAGRQETVDQVVRAREFVLRQHSMESWIESMQRLLLRCHETGKPRKSGR